MSAQDIRDSIFVLPVGEQYLIYAPLHHVAAVTNNAAVAALRTAFDAADSEVPAGLDELAAIMKGKPAFIPQTKSGPVIVPMLGLIPTRGCNFACRYCDFIPPDDSPVMDIKIAHQAIDWYIDQVHARGEKTAAIHYFGGEPFSAFECLEDSLGYARQRATEFGIDMHFEVSTNGGFSTERAKWAARAFNTIVLSFDGPDDIQNFHRPYQGNYASFTTLDRTARILAEGPVNLYIRSCVTGQTVERIPDIARWFCDTYHPAGVAFEPLMPTSNTSQYGMDAPDPWTFSTKFIHAAQILESAGVQPIYATANIQTRQISFCPVGKDVVIVSPQGHLHACYLLPREWEARGMQMTLGSIDHDAVRFNMDEVNRIRALNVQNKPFCARCFAKWHCAGGCHVNHRLPQRPGNYDRLCIQTRALVLRTILHVMGRDDLIHTMLRNQHFLQKAVLQPADTLIHMEVA